MVGDGIGVSDYVKGEIVTPKKQEEEDENDKGTPEQK